MFELGKVALEKHAKVYYFDRESGTTRDISDLDPAADEKFESGWGGLTEWSGRVADIVAKAAEARGKNE
jgi:hypothetical protein